MAGIEKLHQQDIDATLLRDPVALTDLWTDDAVRPDARQPAEAGKQVIREGDERWSSPQVSRSRVIPQRPRTWRSWTAGRSSGVTSPVRTLNHRVAKWSRRKPRGCWSWRGYRTEVGSDSGALGARL